MPEYHSHYDNIVAYLNSLVETCERLTRDCEITERDNRALHEQLEELSSHRNDSSSSESPTKNMRWLEEKNRELEALVIELTQRLEERVDAESN